MSLSSESATSLAASIVKALNSVLDSPTQVSTATNILSDADMETMSSRAIPTQATNSCSHWKILQQIRDSPSSPAVCSWDQSLTYGELGSYASRLAWRLQKMGVGPEVIVPLAFPKSTWAVVAMVAVQISGGAFVPLDTSASATWLQTIVKDTKATLILTAPSCQDKAQALGIQTLVVNDRTLLTMPEPADLICPTTEPQNASFVTFTSGSTGKPKGIVMTHSALCSTSAAYGGGLEVGPGTRVFQFSAYTFDIGIYDVIVTLMRGGCICVPSEKQRMNDLAGAINSTQANWALMTPTLAGTLSPQQVPRSEDPDCGRRGSEPKSG